MYHVREHLRLSKTKTRIKNKKMKIKIENNNNNVYNNLIESIYRPAALFPALWG